MCIRRGDIYYADLRPVVGSEQGGVRPVLILQNDVGNRHSPTVICAPITSRNRPLPTHVGIPPRDGMHGQSCVVLEQIRTIDKRRLKERVAGCTPDEMQQVDLGLIVSLGIGALSLDGIQ